MADRIKQYIAYVDGLLESEDDCIDWDEESKKHLVQIAFFAHERLIHLIVFFLVALCTVISILTFVVSSQIVILPIIIMLFVLLIPYCMHYYLLENSVQKMYEQYDKMMEKKGEKHFSVVPK